MSDKSMARRFLLLARPEGLEEYGTLLHRAARAWAQAQQAFLEVTDRYLEQEFVKPADDNIHQHEAGGQWRNGWPGVSGT